MNANKILYLVVFLLVGFESFAGTFVGNGGDVVVCRTHFDEIISVELLDLYEGRVHFGLQPQLDSKNSLPKNLQTLFLRTKVNNYGVPGGAKSFKNFMSEANFLSKTSLIDVPDSWHLSFPKGCEVEQIVIQVNPSKKFEKRYTVNKDLWDLLDNSNKAALVFHELLYRHKIEKALDHTKINSRDVRYMVALSAADRVSEAFPDAKHYLEFLHFDLWIDEPAP